jgi:hypothetical protein
MRRQTAHIGVWPAFGISGETAEKLEKISPASIGRYLEKDKEALRPKGKSPTKLPDSLKSRIPIRAFYTGGERQKPGFWQTDTVHHCGQAASGQYPHTLTATDVASGWIELHSLLNNAHKWAFEALSSIKTSTLLPVLEFHSDNGSEFTNIAGTGIGIGTGRKHPPHSCHGRGSPCAAEVARAIVTTVKQTGFFPAGTN